MTRSFMRSSQLAARAVLSGALACLLTAGSAVADPTYRIVDLGPLGFTADPDQIGTFDINDHNQVAYGLADASGVVRPTVWLPESAYTASTSRPRAAPSICSAPSAGTR